MSAAGHRRAGWVAVVVGALLLATGGVVAALGYAATSSPDGVVRTYFADLERGDAADALALGFLPEGPHTLLTSLVLAEQQRIAPIRGVSITAVAASGSRATVHVRYRVEFAQAPQTVNDVVGLRHVRGAWRMTRAAVVTQLQVTEAVQRASIVGAGVPDGDTLMFPGAVPIRFDTPYLRLDAHSAVIAFGALPTTQIVPVVSAAGMAAMRAAVTRLLAACLNGTAAELLRCPQPDERYVPGSIRGSLVRSSLRNIAISVTTERTGVLYASGIVQARARYERLTFENQPVRGAGVVRLPVRAHAYAVTPLRVMWEPAS